MSPTRRSARRSNCNATFHVDSEVEIRSSLLRNGTLGDEGSGAVPPTTPIDGRVDFPELNGPINEDLSPMPLFDQRIMKDSLMGLTFLDFIAATFYFLVCSPGSRPSNE